MSPINFTPPEILACIFIFLTENSPRSALAIRHVCKKWKEIFDGLVYQHATFITIGCPLAWEYITGWARLRSMTLTTVYHEVSPVVAWFNNLDIFHANDLDPIMVAYSDSAVIYMSFNHPYGFLQSDVHGFKYFDFPHDNKPDIIGAYYEVWDTGDNSLAFRMWGKVCILTIDSTDSATFSRILSIDNDATITQLPSKKGIRIEEEDYDVFIVGNHIHTINILSVFGSNYCVCIDATDNEYTFLTTTSTLRWTLTTGVIEIIGPAINIKGTCKFAGNREIYTQSRDELHNATKYRVYRVYTYDPVSNTAEILTEKAVRNTHLYPDWWVPKANIGCGLDELNTIQFHTQNLIIGAYNMPSNIKSSWFDYETHILTLCTIENNENNLPCLKKYKFLLNV